MTDKPKSASLPASVWIVVTLAAAATSLLSFSAGRLWYATDSAKYIELAIGMAEGKGFSQELFQFRLPGYPLMLAAIFRLFGHSSPVVIQFVQHAMVAATAVLAAGCAWILRPRPSFAILTGLLSAGCLQLLAYANTVLTEAPHALVVTLCVYMLLRFKHTGALRWLAIASLAAGLCATTKGIGQLMILLCLVVAAHDCWTRLRRPSRVLACAVLPAAALVTPIFLNSWVHFGRWQLTCQSDLILYHRAVMVEGLDSDSSESLQTIKETVRMGHLLGITPAHLPDTDPWAFEIAYRRLFDASISDAADILGSAARDLVAQNRLLMLTRGPRYAYRTMFMPDLYYLVVPGAMPDDMFDVRHEAARISRIVGPDRLERFLPLDTRPTATSAALGRVTHSIREQVDKAPPIAGFMSNRYEEFILLCVLGGAIGLVRANRVAWLIPAAAIVIHVVVSSYLGGVWTRYTVPVLPLVYLYGAFAIASALTLVWSAIIAVTRHSAAPRTIQDTLAPVR